MVQDASRCQSRSPRALGLKRGGGDSSSSSTLGGWIGFGELPGRPALARRRDRQVRAAGRLHPRSRTHARSCSAHMPAVQWRSVVGPRPGSMSSCLVASEQESLDDRPPRCSSGGRRVRGSRSTASVILRCEFLDIGSLDRPRGNSERGRDVFLDSARMQQPLQDERLLR